MKKRIVTLRLAQGDKHSRRTCRPQYGLQSYSGKSAGIRGGHPWKQPRGRSPTRKPNRSIRNFSSLYHTQLSGDSLAMLIEVTADLAPPSSGAWTAREETWTGVSG
jgi:hypothetical protein